MDKQVNQKLLALIAIGSMFEYYDFMLYGVFSSTITKLFFPAFHDPYIDLLISVSIFGIAYLARPIGGIIFSQLAEYYGKSRILIITMIIIGTTNLVISILPPYATWGVKSTIILITCRFLQGFSLAGELPNSICFLYNHSESGSKLKNMQLMAIFVILGIVLSNLVLLILEESSSQDFFINYGWRIAFAAGGVICFISYFIRRTLLNNGLHHQEVKLKTLPLITLFKQHKSLLLDSMLLTLMPLFGLILVSILLPQIVHMIDNVTLSLISRVSIQVSALITAVILVKSLNYLFKSQHALFMGIVIHGLGINLMAWVLFMNGYYLLGYFTFTLYAFAMMISGVPYALSIIPFGRNLQLSALSMNLNLISLIVGAILPECVLLLTKQFNSFLTLAIINIIFCLLAVAIVRKTLKHQIKV